MLDVIDVHRRFGTVTALDGVSLRVEPGEIVGFVGRNGAGAERWIGELGLEGRQDEQVDRLSLGNQQWVQLAGALVCEPDLLVMDEPFSGLDPIGVDVLSRVLRQQAAAGAAALFSSHQLELVERLCDRVVIIDEGRLVTDEAVTGSLRDRFLEVSS